MSVREGDQIAEGQVLARLDPTDYQIIVEDRVATFENAASNFERAKEFLEENDNLVVGLREGAMLRIRGSQVRLVGTRGARLFRRGAEPEEYEPGADLDFLTA